MSFKKLVPAFLTLLILFSACKKEPFENQPIYLKMLGQWQIVKIEQLNPSGTVKATINPSSTSFFNFEDSKGQA